MVFSFNICHAWKEKTCRPEVFSNIHSFIQFIYYGKKNSLLKVVAAGTIIIMLSNTNVIDKWLGK